MLTLWTHNDHPVRLTNTAAGSMTNANTFNRRSLALLGVCFPSAFVKNKVLVLVCRSAKLSIRPELRNARKSNGCKMKKSTTGFNWLRPTDCQTTSNQLAPHWRLYLPPSWGIRQMHLDLQAPSQCHIRQRPVKSASRKDRTDRYLLAPSASSGGEKKYKNSSIINDLPSSLLVAVLAVHTVIKASRMTTQHRRPFTEHIFECSISAYRIRSNASR